MGRKISCARIIPLTFILKMFLIIPVFLSGCGTSDFMEGLIGNAQTIIFVGAHPDDELTVSQFIARAREEKGLECLLLILTHGEGGECALQGGCYPDLATVREEELLKSAENLQCSVTLGNFPNEKKWYRPVEEVYEQWTSLGAREFIKEKVSGVKNPLVISFDPESGYTGHSEHRTASIITFEVLREMKGVSLYYVLNYFMGISQLREEGIFAIDVERYYPVLLSSWKCYLSQVDPFLQSSISTVNLWKRIFLKKIL